MKYTKPISRDELLSHSGHSEDTIKVDAYSSVWAWLFRQKLKGNILIPGGEEKYKDRKCLFMVVYGKGIFGTKGHFLVAKEGYSEKDIMEEILSAVPPEMKGYEKRRWKNNIITLEQIALVECKADNEHIQAETQ